MWRPKPTDAAEHIVAYEYIGLGELSNDARLVRWRDARRGGHPEVALEKECADAFGSRPRTRKYRSACNRNGRIVEELDDALGPTVWQADAVVQEGEDPALGPRCGLVETHATGIGRARDHSHLRRRVWPDLARSHDHLARGFADDLEHVIDRSPRPRVHGVNRDNQAERRRLGLVSCPIRVRRIPPHGPIMVISRMPFHGDSLATEPSQQHGPSL